MENTNNTSNNTNKDTVTEQNANPTPTVYYCIWCHEKLVPGDRHAEHCSWKI